jgi:hypothetical protein
VVDSPYVEVTWDDEIVQMFEIDIRDRGLLLEIAS